MSSRFLVENYSPGMSAANLEAAGKRIGLEVEALARLGKRVRILQTAVVPGDEALLCIIDASSEELIREAFSRAGVTFDRISEAVNR